MELPPSDCFRPHLQTELPVVGERESEHAELDALGEYVENSRALVSRLASVLRLRVCNVNK